MTQGTMLKTQNLTKRFDKILALDGLNLEILPGQVFGLLGPNGSGKTTAISLILGLIWPSGGKIYLFGEELRPETLKRVGAVMDSHGFDPSYSGRDNLRMFGSLHKKVDEKRVDEVIGLVGLANRAHSSLKSYSMGMKQRLSIALAILDDPELLIFDEPTNGMDPEGIAEIRDLISQLARQGKTVLLASHMLAEVEQVCTHMAILKHGKVVKQGDMLKIMLEAGRSELELVVVDPEKAVAVLFDAGYNARIEDGMVVVTAHEGQAEHVSAVLADHGLFIKEMRRRKSNLESVFLEATGGNKNQ